MFSKEKACQASHHPARAGRLAGGPIRYEEEDVASILSFLWALNFDNPNQPSIPA